MSSNNRYGPRTARKRTNKSSSSMMLFTVAFLLLLCGVLYGVYTAKRGDQKQPLAESISVNREPAANNGQTANDQPAVSGQTGSAGAPQTTPVAEVSPGSVDAQEVSAADTGRKATGSSDSTSAASASNQENISDKTSTGSGQAEKLPTTYVVHKGDTLSTISMKFYHSKQYVNLLAEHNDLVFINDMKPGDTIKIPALPSDGGAATKNNDDNVDYSKVTLPVTYMVRPGDTLYRLSMLFYQSGDYVDLIAEQNKLDKSKGLKAGTNLVIPALPGKNQTDADNSSTPSVKEHIVQQGETLYSISRKFYNSDKYAKAIAEYNHLKDGDDVKVGSVLKIPAEPET